MCPQPQTGVVTLDAAALGLPAHLAASELVSGRTLTLTDARFPATLAPQETWALRVR